MLLLIFMLMNLVTAQNHHKCTHTTKSCGTNEIRFPFQLQNDAVSSPNTHCGYPGFTLSCTKNNLTILELPSNPARLSVKWIDYESQRVHVYDSQACLPRLFLQLQNSSIHPFQYDSESLLLEGSRIPSSVTFFDCSSVGSRYLRNDHVSFSLAQDMFACPIYAAASDQSVIDLDLVSCTNMFEISSLVSAKTDLPMNMLTLKWGELKCDVGSFYCDHKPSKLLTVVLPVTGSILLVLLFIGFFLMYRYFKMKGDDEVRLEKFLEDYRALRPTRFSYADLKRITKNFKDKLGEGAHGAVFKGELSTEIPVAVKVLNNNSEGDDGKEFIAEVGTMGKIHHINVVRLLGFCADGFDRALVYDFFPNGSLQKFVSSPDKKENFLGWPRVQQIALGIARGIEYLHQGCDHRILHFDINPRNVLLDHNLTPKITDFGLAKLCSKNQSTVSMTAARGTLGYIAPEVFSRNFGNVSYKSDIYSYGMLMLEMVGGRKNTIKNEETFQILYPEWIHNLVKGGDIDIHIEEEEDGKIAKKLAIVGLWCIQWNPMNRPSMKTVVQMVEQEGDKLKVPPTPFDSTTLSNTNAIIPTRRMNLELEVIRELE
ncbi:rust resistance kinase Lr10-like [Senna tora]|uniref:Rust resistance kinase Lr10-like n=1 Tax=Senna tora TaxID=362788 RepID=A0A834W2S6_9FABA|nr:rust resistance kinase Lr10-like [Senna tora]